MLPWEMFQVTFCWINAMKFSHTGRLWFRNFVSVRTGLTGKNSAIGQQFTVQTFSNWASQLTVTVGTGVIQRTCGGSLRFIIAFPRLP
jgi:hypothetical protein